MKKLPSRLTINVNPTNIRRGIKGDSEECAISKAVQRLIQAKRRGLKVSVAGGDDIEVIDQDGHTIFYKGRTEVVRKRINNFISRFDRKKNSVQPTKFRIVRQAD